jgi:galactosylceramidase
MAVGFYCSLLVAASASNEYVLDDGPGFGLRWEGVGAISGGGATTKLLKDYPAKPRSDVLDFLFKPNYGLGLQILKVELGGDTDATEGAEPSHMHYKGDENYQRGYEWWLMKEAKARNPDIKLYGLPWGWPGWLDPSATADKSAKNAFADPDTTANYTLAWLLGAKREHGLVIDYVGQWNERDAPKAYDEALRKAVGGSEIAKQTTVLNRLPHYPGTTDSPDSQGCKQYSWNTKDGSRWVDEEGSIFDGRSARCLARCVNRNYVSGCHTATFQWHLVSSFYDYLPWARDGVAVANQPWSGAFEVTSPTWSLAHTSQFAPIGWRYAAHGSGVDMLKNGGSIVTRVSPDLKDFSVVIEKMSSANSNCARGSNPSSSPSSEDVVITLKGAFLAAARRSGVNVWYSNLASSNDQGLNPPDAQLFQKKGQLPVASDGTLRLSVNPEELYTLTTLSVGGKGIAHSPEATPFPIPFTQSFDDESIFSPPRIWYDQMGAWEIQKSPYGDDGSRGNVMRQVVPVWPECWGYSCAGPTTYFGPSEFTGDLEVSMDLRLEDLAVFTLDFLTLQNKGTKYSKLQLDTAGKFTLGKSSGNVNFGVNTWHSISVRNAHEWQAVTMDGKVIANVSLSTLNDASCDNQSFPYDNAGWQYLGLSPGPTSATTVEACQQVCCDAGVSCNIYQFSEHPSRSPECWIGQSTSRVPSSNYQSRSKTDPTSPPYHLKAMLSRYIFASIDNFKIERGALEPATVVVV